MGKPWRKTVLANLGVLLATVLVLVTAIEASLRVTGFSYVLYPEKIEFGKPDPQLLETGFLADDDVFWVTKDYSAKLERLRRERPPLIFMGDSCTQFGRYDDAFAALWAARRGTPLRYGNLGVAGWSSYQGRRQFERDVVGLEPRVVTLYYGWNDHWIGFGIEDKNVATVRKVFSSRFSGLRVVQLAMKAVVAWGARETAYPNRVSLGDFGANLRAIADLARERGIRPVLITAATSIREGREPEYLENRHLRERAELVPLHRAYAQAVRDLAGDAGVALCDVEARWAQLPQEEVAPLFLGDGIHLTDAGNQRLAEELYDCFERDRLVDALAVGNPMDDSSFHL